MTNAGLQAAKFCYCGQKGAQYDMHGLALANPECDYTCAGNNVQMCGGLLKNSVYDLWGKM